MKGIFLFTIVLLAAVSIEGHGNGWCRGPRSHLNRRFDVGYALRFDGNDFVELPTLSIGGALTFEFFLNVQNQKTGPIFSFGPSNNNIEVSFDNNKKLVFTATRPGSGNSNAPTTALSNSVNRNGWQYFIITVENNNRRITFYSADDDGTVNTLGNPQTLSFVPTWASRSPGYIGRSSKTNSYFSGDLDELRVWSRVLPTSEMDRDRDIPEGDSSLIAWWNFNQGLGIIATDVSFQGRDGTLGGNNFSATPEWIISQFSKSRSCKIYRDVSIKTFDRKCFRIPTNNVGDFWLVDGVNAGVLAIQVRIQSKPGNNQGTVVQQLAFQYAGKVYKWDLDFATKSDSFFYVNNLQINLDNFEDATTGVSVYKSYTGNAKHNYDVNAPLGFSMKIEAFPRDLWTDITVRIPFTNVEAVDGLCGDFNLDQGNDDSQAVKDGWPVDPIESLFQGPVNFTYPDEFPCNFNPGSTLETDANRICNNQSIIAPYLSAQCLDEICKAGDIGAAYPLAEVTYQDCVDDAVAFCRPPCPNFCSLQGTCQLSGVCTCSPGFMGVDCSQKPNFACYQASFGNKRRQIYSFRGTQSAIDHYSYSRQFPFSSASGKELSDTTNLYLYNEISTNFLSLIHLNDKARDNTGGRVRATYSVTGPNPTVKVFDDPSWVDDSYTSVVGGNFTANWQWWGCCTDGLVLEVLRGQPNNFCVAVNLTRFEGINQVVLSSENNYGSSDIYRLDNDRVSICGATCNNTCGTYSSCQGCTSDPQCGWCVETETCELGTAGGPDRGRCNIWRFSNRNNVARVVKTQVSYPVDPSSVSIYLPVGQTAKADFFVFVPSSENLPLDIVLSLDVTKYFGNDLAYIQSSTAAVFSSMSTYYPQARLGITSFSDVPFQPLGSPSQGDFAYQENLALTSNVAFIQSTLNAMIPRDGGDAQNSQLVALYNAARSNSLNWRTNAMKLLVVITKSDFHAPPTSGLPSGATEYPTPTLVRDALLNANIVPIFVVPTTLQSRYQSLVSQWGFGYVRGISSISAANIFTGIQETVGILSTSIRAISLPSTAPNVNSIYPAEGYTGVSAGTRVTFTATLSSTISGGATVIVPGFGKVDFSFITSDLPSGASQTITALNGGSSSIAQLYAYGFYGQAYPEITSLPSTSVARLFQVVNGNQQGAAINTVPATISDLTNKVWIQFGASGNSSFSYQVKDSCLACSPSNYSVSINFQTTNQAPTATPSGVVSFPEDGSANITVTGTDPEDGTNVVAVISSFPTSGSLFQTNGVLITSANPVVNSGNKVTFRPVANAFGPPPTNLYSSFTFVVRDSQGLQSSPALVSIYVTPLNDPPTASGGPAASTNEDTPINIVLTGNDIDGDSLTYVLFSIPSAAIGTFSRVAGGAPLAVNSVLTTNNVWFNPASNYNGQTSFQFRAYDGQVYSQPANVNINVLAVNDAPTTQDQPFTGDEDSSVPITLSGNDIDSSVLRAIICNWNGIGTLRQFQGAIISPGSNIPVTDAGRQLTYIPPPNAFSNGIPLTSFTFKITDGTLESACAVASITIRGAYDAPVAIGPAQVYTNESQSVSITLRAQDADLIQVGFRICKAPLLGTLQIGAVVLADNSSFTGLFTPPDLTFVTVVYTPVSGGNGSPYTSFSFRADDGAAGSPCVNVSIFVASVNDPPVVTNATLPATEDTDYYYTLTATDDDAVSQLQFNITRLPSRGSLLQGLNRVPINTVPTKVTNNTIVFVPAANEFGPNYDSFDFVAYDLSEAVSVPATVGVSVASVNDKPIAYPFTVSSTDQTSFFINQFSGYDVENGTNVAVVINTTTSSGTMYVCQTLNDANCDTIVFSSAVIAPLNRVRFVPDPTRYNTYTLTFTYSVLDPENLISDIVTVVLNITKTNNPPTVIPVQSPVQTFLGDITVIEVQTDDPDVGQNVVLKVDPTDLVGFLFQCTPSGLTCVQGAPILTESDVLDINGNTGRVVFQAPAPNPITKSGDITTIRFRGVDSLSLSSTIVAVVVELFTRTEPLVPISTSLSFDEKSTNVPFTLAVNTTGSVVFTITSLPTNGNLTQSDGTPISQVPTNVTNGGNIYYVKPDSFSNGNPFDNFTWTATVLSTGAATPGPVLTTVSVSSVNDAPIPMLSQPEFDEDVGGLLQLTAYDPDVVYGDVLSFILTAAPTQGGRFYQVSAANVTDFSGAIISGQPISNPFGFVYFVPPANYYTKPSAADIIFRYTVRDSAGLLNGLDVKIIVNAVNDLPIAFNSRYSGQNNLDVTTFTLNNFTDIEVSASEQTATLNIVSTPDQSKGLLYNFAVSPQNLVVPNGNYSSRIFKFVTAQPGVFSDNYASFLWRVSDGLAFSDPATATIDIKYFNTPPTVVQPSLSLIADENSTMTFVIAATDPDASDSVTLEFSVIPTRGVLTYYDEDQYLDVPITTSTILQNQTVVTYTSTPGLNGADTFTIQARDYRNLNPLDISVIKPLVTITVRPINNAPTMSNTQTSIISNGYGLAAVSSLVVITDDASENNGIVTLRITSTSAERVKLTNAGSVQGYNPNATVTSLTLNGTVSQLNGALAAGVEFYPANGASTGTLVFNVNDNGNNDYRTGQPGLTVGPLSIAVNVDSQGTLDFSAGFIGVTTLMSAGVFGAYKVMKKKKLIPEEADPWENDELFDMTLDNPLYSGSNPSSLEAVFDSK